MKRGIILALALALAVIIALPAGAITKGGELDGQDHPYVGLMVADDADGNPMWRCSGTLISPYVYVTAGHCTDGAAGATVWFETDLEPDTSVFGYPFAGSTSVEGTPYTHPLYDPNGFFLYDLGVVVLDEPYHTPNGEYASLPTEGAVDDLGHGRKQAVVTAVGYGLQQVRSNPAGPDFLLDDKTRYQADLFVVDTNGVAGIGSLPDTNSMILSGDAKHGGTCFGDSGGPMLVGDTIMAVNSFGLNGNCAGIGGAFRIDRALELEWISGFLN